MPSEAVDNRVLHVREPPTDDDNAHSYAWTISSPNGPKRSRADANPAHVMTDDRISSSLAVTLGREGISPSESMYVDNVVTHHMAVQLGTRTEMRGVPGWSTTFGPLRMPAEFDVDELIGDVRVEPWDTGGVLPTSESTSPRVPSASKPHQSTVRDRVKNSGSQHEEDKAAPRHEWSMVQNKEWKHWSIDRTNKQQDMSHHVPLTQSLPCKKHQGADNGGELVDEEDIQREDRTQDARLDDMDTENSVDNEPPVAKPIQTVDWSQSFYSVATGNEEVDFVENAMPTFSDQFAVGGSLIVVSCMICFGLSAMPPGSSYEIYARFMESTRVATMLGMFTASFVVFLHTCNVYILPKPYRAALFFAVVELSLATGACLAKYYPAAPLVVANIQIPVLMATLHSLLNLSPSRFLRVSGLVFLILIVMLSGTFIVWMFAYDSVWSDTTRDTLYTECADVFLVYGVESWEACEHARSLEVVDTETSELLDSCNSIEVTVQLIYACPLVLNVVLATLCVACFMCAAALGRRHEHMGVLKVALGFVALLITGTWVGCSAAGAASAVSNLYMGGFLAVGMLVGAWTGFGVNLERLKQLASRSILFEVVRPVHESEWTRALLAVVLVWPLGVFFSTELLVRAVKGPRGTEAPWLTTRGQNTWKWVSALHWCSLLERMFCVCIMYLVFFLFARATPVFLARVSDMLPKNIYLVTPSFYMVGLVMFLLPFVPGVPVYIAGGFIIYNSGGKEWGFFVAVVYASALCLVLKLNAVVVQQKMFGELMGSSLTIQHHVGVHTQPIRAIERILTRPGLTLAKVCILCGGPDWPTSVLTGILRCHVGQMLLGTLPCILLVVPAVLAGASLFEESAQSLSATLVMAVGISQGAAFFAAMLFVAKETRDHFDELSTPRPEHQAVIDKALEITRKLEEYKQRSCWHMLSVAQKVFVIASASVEHCSCCGFTFLASMCFRDFSIGDDFEATIEMGGLEGDVRNLLIYPSGTFFFYFMLFGCVLYVTFRLLTMCSLHKEGDTRAARTFVWIIKASSRFG